MLKYRSAVVVLRKSTAQLFELQAELASFSMERHVYLEELLKYKLWLFKLGCLAERFKKINEMNLLFQLKKKTAIFSKVKI